MKKRITVGSVVSAILKLLLIVIFIFPFYWMIITGFKTYQETIAFPPSLWPQSLQWENFTKVWNSGPYLTYLWNSVLVSVGTLVLQTLVMIPAAYAFAKFEFKGRGFLFGIVMVAFMIPQQDNLYFHLQHDVLVGLVKDAVAADHPARGERVRHLPAAPEF